MKRVCQPQQCGLRRNAQYQRNLVSTVLFIFGLGKFGKIRTSLFKTYGFHYIASFDQWLQFTFRLHLSLSLSTYVFINFISGFKQFMSNCRTELSFDFNLRRSRLKQRPVETFHWTSTVSVTVMSMMMMIMMVGVIKNLQGSSMRNCHHLSTKNCWFSQINLQPKHCMISLLLAWSRQKSSWRFRWKHKPGMQMKLQFLTQTPRLERMLVSKLMHLADPQASLILRNTGLMSTLSLSLV